MQDTGCRMGYYPASRILYPVSRIWHPRIFAHEF